MNKVKIIAFFVISSTQLSAFAQQVGPGGVGNSATLAFWMDANQMGLSNGDPVATITDFSGNNNDATQGVAADQPTFATSGLINSMPSIVFDGTDFANTGALSELNTDEISWFSVSRAVGNLSTGEQRRILASKHSVSSGELWGLTLKEESNSVSVFNSNSRSTTTLVFNSVNIATSSQLNPYIHSSIWRNNDNLTAMLNGTANSEVAGANSGGGTHEDLFIGRKAISATQFYIGQIPEIIVYYTEINSAQEIIITNYLSAKYGISIGGTSRYDNSATHGQELAGIGREDASNQHLTARGTSIVEITAASLDNSDYLLWAHDGGGTTTTTTNVPNSYVATNGDRLAQIWMVTETGETGDITLSFDLTGITFGDADEYELLISSDGDFTGVTGIVGAEAADVITFTVPAGSLSDGDFFTIGNTHKTINSIVDGQDWDDPTTWDCTCIPAIENNLNILDGHNVTLTDDREIEDLNIAATGGLTLDPGVSLDIYGDLSVSGSMVSDITGTVSFLGSVQQTIDFNGTAEFGNVVLNNSTGVLFNTGTYEISGVLTPTDGANDFNNNLFTFMSTAAGTAVLGVTGGTASFANFSNVRVQRFIPASSAGLRNMGTPLTTMAMNQWDDEIFISGTGFPDGCAYTTSGCYHSVKYWNGGAYHSVTDIDSAISNGAGLEIFLGDNLTTFNAHTLQASGSLNTSLSVDLSIESGWNFVANPFLSPVDFDNVTLNGGIGNYFYVYEPAVGYQFWDGDGQSASVANFNGGLLSAFQGFWVFNSGGATTMTFNQASKSVSSSDAFLKQDFAPDRSYMSVSLKSHSNSIFSMAGVKFNNDALLNLDGQDLRKLPNQVLNTDKNDNNIFICSKDVEGDMLVVNALPNLDECTTLPFYIEVQEAGEYDLQFDNLPAGYNFYFVDKQTGEIMLLQEGLIQPVFVQTEGALDNRFNIVIAPKNCEKTTSTSSSFDLFMNEHGLNIVFGSVPEDYRMELYDLSGKLVFTSPNITDGELVKNFNIALNEGIYLVAIIDQVSGSSTTRKLSVR